MKDRERYSQVLRRLAAGTIAAALLLVDWPPAPARAQSAPGGNSNVIIDYGVLEQLGPPRSTPRLLPPGAPAPAATPQPLASSAPSGRTTPGPVVLQPPVEERPPAAQAPAAPKRTASKPAPVKRTAAKKPTSKTKSARGAPAAKKPTKTAVAQGPSPPLPEPKPTDLASVASPPSPPTAAGTPPGEPPPAFAEVRPPTFEPGRIPEPPPPPPPPAVSSTPDPAPPRPDGEVARVAPAAGAKTGNGDAPAVSSTAQKPTPPKPAAKPPASAKAPAVAAPAERTGSAATPSDEIARAAIPPPPKIAAPPPPAQTQPSRQANTPAKPAAPANGAAVASTSGARPESAEQVRLDFVAGANELDGDARGKLDDVANGLSRNPKLRLQLLAYAGGSNDAGSQARRLSLSRALSVRSYLIDKGVPSTRIDVRALGNKAEDGPPDRVDVVISQR